MILFAQLDGHTMSFTGSWAESTFYPNYTDNSLSI